jgi:hypothetical protein
MTYRQILPVLELMRTLPLKSDLVTSDLFAVVQAEVFHLSQLKSEIAALDIWDLHERARLSVEMTKRFLSIPLMLRRTMQPSYKSDVDVVLGQTLTAKVPQLTFHQSMIDKVLVFFR